MIENDRLIAPESRIEDQGQTGRFGQRHCLSMLASQPSLSRWGFSWMRLEPGESPLIIRYLRTTWAWKNHTGKYYCCRNVR